MPRIQLRLTPRGHLLLEEANDAPTLDDKVAARLTGAFGRGTVTGILATWSLPRIPRTVRAKTRLRFPRRRPKPCSA